MEMTQEHIEELKNAKLQLENISFAVKVSNLIGKPIEIGMNRLPEKYKPIIMDTTRKILLQGVNLLTYTFNNNLSLNNISYKIGVAVTGSLGGMFGLASFIAEAPVSTMVMLRAIMETAKRNGEDLGNIETSLSCLSVFAFGNISKSGDSSESGYYSTRYALAKSISKAAEFIAEKGLVEEGAPVIVKFITNIATKFGAVLTEKAAAVAVPLIGAVSGAIINILFINHFQNMAEGHFTVRRLERVYTKTIVQNTYQTI